MMRLQRFIALAGVCSRRKAEELIKRGDIKVNGLVISELGSKIDENKDEVVYRGRVLKAENFEYYLLNKPVGYSSTVSDPHAEKTVLELIPSAARLFPVGRLDRETEGLLLLTNDGDFYHRVIHPRANIAKIYEAALSKPLSEEDILKLKTGFFLDEKEVKMAEIQLLNPGKNLYKIVIYQGRKRQIRRMIEEVGKSTVYLRRLQLGGLKLGNLPLGKYRPLLRSEIDMF